MTVLTSDPNVQSYALPELASASLPDDVEGRLALINKLGLHGQKSLIADGKPALRFRLITPVESIVFQNLFPTVTKLADFSSESIPLAVLSLVDDALSQGLHRPTVWSPARAGDPDPVLVMYADHRPYYDSECYLIARWGHPLLSFESLISLWRERATAAISSVRAKADVLLAQIAAGPHSFSTPPLLNAIYS